MSDLLFCDVSEFQPNADFVGIRQQSPIVACRTAYGLTPDKTMPARRDRIRAAQFEVVVWYLFLRASQDAEAQALATLEMLGPLQRDEFLCVDYESDAAHLRRVSRRAINLADKAASVLPTVAQRDLAASTFEKHSGRNTLIYMSLASAQSKPDPNRHLWLPAYQTNEPSLPHLAWQRTDAGGPWPGCGRCDTSVFHGPIADFVRALMPIPAPLPPLEDNDMSNLTIDWPDGANSILTPDGAIDNWPLADASIKTQPAPSYGSFYDLAPSERQALNWPLGETDVRSLCPVDINDKAAGMVASVFGSDGAPYDFKFDAGFAQQHGVAISPNKLSPQEGTVLTFIKTFLTSFAAQNPAQFIGRVVAVLSAVVAFLVTLTPALSKVNGWEQVIIVIGSALVPYITAKSTGKAVLASAARGKLGSHK